jgi:hypothetical protein
LRNFAAIAKSKGQREESGRSGPRPSIFRCASAARPATRLNPFFDFDDQPVVMVTQFMAAVPTGILKISVGKLDEEFEKVAVAIDMLFQGF